MASLSREKGFHQQYIEELRPAHGVSQRNTHIRAIVNGIGRSIMFFAYSTAIFYGGRLIVDEGVGFQDIFK